MFIPAKRLTSAIRHTVTGNRLGGVLTGLRVEVLGIAHLHWTSCSVYGGVVVNRIFFCNLVGVYRSICLALGHMSDTNAVSDMSDLP